MKKLLIALGVLAALGIGYWLISPLFIERAVEEGLEDIAGAEEMTETGVAVLSEGSFEGLAGHNAEGTARIVEIDGKRYLRFEDDFRITNGPDLFVHFGKDGEYAGEARLGLLKGNVGGQNYEIPGDIDSSLYNEVWVWCRAFHVPFGKAVLE